MSITNIFALLGGVALFLFGMNLMGDGLKKVAGSKLELILYRLTSSPIKGILLGTGVTAVIQSSSATSVMVVGFVNSGMMKVKQAIGTIMGAIIGTSVTGWVICLSAVGGGGGIFEIISTDTLTTLLAVIGIILLMFTKRETNHHVAGILLGFAVLMFGIGAMTDAVYPLRESETFIHLLTTFSNPLIGILLGLAFTAVIQSASAAVGILQTLAVTGAVSFGLALPVIMGIAIGASVPVLLSALGTNVNGKRTALIYLLVDTLGAAIVSLIFYTANAIFHFSFLSLPMSMMSIALLNTCFRLVIVALLTPFIGLMEKFVKGIIKDEPAKPTPHELRDIERLEEIFLSHPALALERARITINSMAELTKEDFEQSAALFERFDEAGFARVDELEGFVDSYEDKLGNYVAEITRNELSYDQRKTVNKYLHTINDFERISDHAKNLSESAREIFEKEIHFSSTAVLEMQNLISAVKDILNLTVKAFIEDDMDAAHRIEPLEEVIDNLCDTYKARHIERVQRGVCQYHHGYVYNDMLTNFERVGDHCSNIGIAIRMDHDEIDEEHASVSTREMVLEYNFVGYYEEYRRKYHLD